MRLHRLIGIILLIESRGVIKAKDLAQALETSERTIYRDIDILCESGIAIKSVPGPSGGFAFMEGYKLNMNRMHCDDVINLLLSGMGVRPEDYTENALSLKNAILKLENSVPKEYASDIKRAKERFYFDPSPWWKEVIPNENFDIIRAAVWQSKKLSITYKKPNGAESDRIIHPYGLIVKDSEWYVAAFCEKRNEVRAFKCSRIHNVSKLEEKFDGQNNFDIEAFWNGSVKRFKEETIKPQHRIFYPVQIKLSHKKGELLKGFEVIDETTGHGNYIYTIDMISFHTACTVIFGVSDTIEVLNPMELKNYIVEKAANILKLNNC